MFAQCRCYVCAYEQSMHSKFVHRHSAVVLYCTVLYYSTEHHITSFAVLVVQYAVALKTLKALKTMTAKCNAIVTRTIERKKKKRESAHCSRMSTRNAAPRE